MKASFTKYTLNFKQASGTSRGILRTKNTYFLKISGDNGFGIGECGLFKGLSADDRPDYEEKLVWTCQNITKDKEFLLSELTEFPSIQFGLEQALLSYKSQNAFELFPSEFTKGNDTININGLIWMGDKAFMNQQIKDKLAQGFKCIKMKIGAIDFQTELDLLKSIRKEFSVNDIELRVDANGAFSPQNALEKLQRLSELDLHSIEQPIKQGQWQEMAQLCESTPLPIALDEELIGLFVSEARKKCLETIQPQYIILKPSLVGGFHASNDWISYANEHAIGWWITSALESNIGLNAIAQYTYTLESKMPQGLGTGSLFTNNIAAPLQVRNGNLIYNNSLTWSLKNIE